MKLDKHLPRLKLSESQSYFAECWYNMVHQHSLDSYRVRVMNPLNILKELKRVYELGTPVERKAVRKEALEILDGDLVLKQPEFANSANQVIVVMRDGGPLAKDKEEGSARNLLFYFITELQELVERDYVKTSFRYLKENLLAPQDFKGNDSLRDERFSQIYTVTSHLLSVLIDQKASIESLFNLYSQILIPREVRQNYQFQREYDRLCAIITESPKEYLIVLALNNVTTPDKFPAVVGGVEFSLEPPLRISDAHKGREGPLKKYLSQGAKKIFASKLVCSRDPRSAGAEAFESISHILNLVRFEYEKAKVVLPEEFAFSVINSENPATRVFNLPCVVPNPSSDMDSDGLTSFVESVDELVLKNRFSQEGRERIYSAFRLYRIGLDTNILENKLMNWWTAIEYLIRGNGLSHSSIGVSIENALVPVLCNAYTAKYLLALKRLLLENNLHISGADQSAISLKALNAHNLYEIFKDKEIQAQVLGYLKDHTYAYEHYKRFFSDLGHPKRLHARNLEHEKRLRWQIQRLWRARCDIVHSAERVVNAALLCANLEYYLKSTLMTVFRSLRNTPTLDGLKEFFDRQAYVYKALQEDLSMDKDDCMDRLLLTY